MKDIFAPKELSQKLREIGFDEPCIAIYSIQDNELKGIIQGEEKLIDNFILGKFTCSSYSGIPAPTWEQVLKWFRERRYLFVIGYDFSAKKYNYRIVIKRHDGASCITSENYSTYEQARENLALELTEIHKKTKQYDTTNQH